MQNFDYSRSYRIYLRTLPNPISRLSDYKISFRHHAPQFRPSLLTIRRTREHVLWTQMVMANDSAYVSGPSDGMNKPVIRSMT
jgi:hypothetical protein